MSGIDLYLDFNGERVRISGARLRTQADADELISAITIVRKLLPEGAIEKAVAVPPAEEVVAPSSSAPITEAPTPLPDDDEVHRPAEAKTSDKEPSVSDGSAGMQDRCESIPAPSSPAKAPMSEEGRTTGKPTRAKAFVAPPGEHQERTAKRIEVAKLHEAEPWLAPDDAAQRLFIPVVNLRIFSQELEIEWSQPRPLSTVTADRRRRGFNNEVARCHEEHPDWSATRIAEELDTSVQYISATAKRLSLTLPLERDVRPKVETLRDRVRAVHLMHPTWTARMIANELGAPHSTVSTYLRDIRAEIRQAAEQAVAA